MNNKYLNLLSLTKNLVKLSAILFVIAPAFGNEEAVSLLTHAKSQLAKYSSSVLSQVDLNQLVLDLNRAQAISIQERSSQGSLEKSSLPDWMTETELLQIFIQHKRDPGAATPIEKQTFAELEKHIFQPGSDFERQFYTAATIILFSKDAQIVHFQESRLQNWITDKSLISGLVGSAKLSDHLRAQISLKQAKLKYEGHAQSPTSNSFEVLNEIQRAQKTIGLLETEEPALMKSYQLERDQLTILYALAASQFTRNPVLILESIQNALKVKSAALTPKAKDELKTYQRREIFREGVLLLESDKTRFLNRQGDYLDFQGAKTWLIPKNGGPLPPEYLIADGYSILWPGSQNRVKNFSQDLRKELERFGQSRLDLVTLDAIALSVGIIENIDKVSLNASTSEQIQKIVNQLVQVPGVPPRWIMRLQQIYTSRAEPFYSNESIAQCQLHSSVPSMDAELLLNVSKVVKRKSPSSDDQPQSESEPSLPKAKKVKTNSTRTKVSLKAQKTVEESSDDSGESGSDSEQPILPASLDSLPAPKPLEEIELKNELKNIFPKDARKLVDSNCFSCAKEVYLWLAEGRPHPSEAEPIGPYESDHIVWRDSEGHPDEPCSLKITAVGASELARLNRKPSGKNKKQPAKRKTKLELPVSGVKLKDLLKRLTELDAQGKLDEPTVFLLALDLKNKIKDKLGIMIDQHVLNLYVTGPKGDRKFLVLDASEKENDQLVPLEKFFKYHLKTYKPVFYYLVNRDEVKLESTETPPTSPSETSSLRRSARNPGAAVLMR